MRENRQKLGNELIFSSPQTGQNSLKSGKNFISSYLHNPKNRAMDSSLSGSKLTEIAKSNNFRPL